SVGYNNLGDVTLQLGKAVEALAFFRKGLEVRQKLASADPRSAEAQRDLSVSYQRLGDVARSLGKVDEALGYYKQGVQIRQKLATDDPKNSQAQLDLFITHWALGRAEIARHDYASAANWFARGRATLLPWHEKKLL